MTPRSILRSLALSWFILAPSSSEACGWDNETYTAEASSLPCVYDIVLGTYPKHTRDFYLTRVKAADAILTWSPAHLDALDMKGIALMKLGELKAAREVMVLRAKLAPQSYASHANLGTLYTFTGEWTAALAEIDAALATEPQAHFGREKYHRKLVVYLQNLAADPSLALRENFLEVVVAPELRSRPNPDAFAKAGAELDAFDALVAMIAVYGAEQNPHIFLTLGELLTLQGMQRLAWTAYERAVQLHHPRSVEIKKWQREISESLRLQHKSDDPNLTYQGIATTFQLMTRDNDPTYSAHRTQAESFSAWEKNQIASGLPVWRKAGLQSLYEKMNKLSPRCKSPGVIQNEFITEGSL